MATYAPSHPPKVLVAGCGKLGGAIAQRLSKNATVYGLRRNPDRVPEGVAGIGADLTRPETLASVLPDGLDVIIYCLTPASYDEQGYRDAYVTGLTNLLSQVPSNSLTRLIFISSTSVYSQDDDSWVDESSPTEPARFSGREILTGEKAALTSEQPATIVRFSGIYGPTRRRFLEEVIEGRMNPSQPAPFSNRIHEDDAARVVEHLVERALTGKPMDDLYIASDCEPARLDEVVNWVREQTPCAEPVEGARSGGRAGSKRCRNQRLLDTGFHFEYPDFRAGYREMIERE